MAHCNGGCSSCPEAGCLSLTPEELAFLQQLGRIPFLPVARRADSFDPVYLEEGASRQEELSRLLLILEKKQLISLDYDQPLRHWDMSAYAAYPLQGSMALTRRGQTVLELTERLGYELE